MGRERRLAHGAGGLGLGLLRLLGAGLALAAVLRLVAFWRIVEGRGDVRGSALRRRSGGGRREKREKGGGREGRRGPRAIEHDDAVEVLAAAPLHHLCQAAARAEVLRRLGNPGGGVRPGYSRRRRRRPPKRLAGGLACGRPGAQAGGRAGGRGGGKKEKTHLRGVLLGGAELLDARLDLRGNREARDEEAGAVRLEVLEVGLALLGALLVLGGGGLLRLGLGLRSWAGAGRRGLGWRG